MKIRKTWSASELVSASACEFAYVRALCGEVEKLEPDAMLERTAVLGDVHEQRVLADYREKSPGLVEIERPRGEGGRAAAVAATLQAVEAQAPVIFQAAVIVGDFVGYADFLVRTEPGAYRIQDTKLARSAKVSALLQMAAYADHLRELGVEVDAEVEVILGDGKAALHALRDVEPVYRVRRDRLREIRAEVASGARAVWGEDTFTACGRCEVCEAEVVEHNDLLLVATLSVVQRRALRAAGIVTVAELADSTGPVAGIGQPTLERLRRQASLQLTASPEPHAAPPLEVIDAQALAALPAPSKGDIFFDFEGDPLYNEDGGDAWGLDYLFGWVDVDERFDLIWAHSFQEEGDALAKFLDILTERRREFPDMHVYHYASYERSHLASLAARHRVGEDVVTDLLRAGVFVDLYPIVRRSVCVGSRSYSIKKLEPLYMGDEYRSDEGVTTALGSVDAYVAASNARRDGDEEAWESGLAQIAHYNKYDCVSTVRLRDWLLERARDHGVTPASEEELEPTHEQDKKDKPPQGETTRGERREIADRLRAFAGEVGDPNRSADEKAIGLVAAAVEFHDREERIAWAEVYGRRGMDLGTLATERGVFVIESAVVEEDWARGKREQSPGRTLRLVGSWAPGSSAPEVSDSVYALYPGGPVTLGGEMPASPLSPIFKGTIREVEGSRIVVLRERLPAGTAEAGHSELPEVLIPGVPSFGSRLKDTLALWGAEIADALDEEGTGVLGEWRTPLLDVFRGLPPVAEITVPEQAANGDPDTIGAIVDTLMNLEGSYLAVQGPPGTGKTYTAGHVMARLARDHGWKIGVVAQSHAVIENALSAVAKAGLEKCKIAKKYSAKPKVELDDLAWTVVTGAKGFAMSDFRAGAGGGGYVLGATAWGHGSEAWDLLVVDEAGQYSLAMTAAAQGKAKRILFLGDPQQLPQVSQASHPEPVDESALACIIGGKNVLAPELGYFLAQTRRMRPELTEQVSLLQYDGKLTAHRVTSTRTLTTSSAGEVEAGPGVHGVRVPHRGNAQSSAEEAAKVVEIVDSLLGASWKDGEEERALGQSDFIVVTPYNAQRLTVKRALEDAGLGEVPVGTVDKFQGQEAVIAIVSMAASDFNEAPRGLDFLMNRNRLNVAISRAQWAAYVVHSPHLLDHLPPTTQGLAILSAFAGLVQEI